MEHQLINALFKLFAKAGGGFLLKDLIQQVDQNRNPKEWTAAEISSAVAFISSRTENFSAADAQAMVDSLQKKFDLSSDKQLRDRTMPSSGEPMPEAPGVHGLT